ncbi:hepatitis A virus cellular receptor 1 homolog [Aquarana catesbeiana]|uniref:hepatitis A virus cellular receptor 1 homolog n=1 Tax=Aquarana catesbeiana TaxID=8400 RepID=UPI003CC9A4ED
MAPYTQWMFALILLHQGLFVSAKDVNGFVGGAVTLPCTYSIKDGTTSMCWGRGKCPPNRCNNPNIWTDGSKVTLNGFDSRYQLLGNISKGDVSLTISNLSKMDEDTYCCRLEIPGWYNDQRHEISVRVHEAPKSTKPALTMWSIGLTHENDDNDNENSDDSSYTTLTSMTPVKITPPPNAEAQSIKMVLHILLHILTMIAIPFTAVIVYKCVSTTVIPDSAS